MPEQPLRGAYHWDICASNCHSHGLSRTYRNLDRRVISLRVWEQERELEPVPQFSQVQVLSILCFL